MDRPCANCYAYQNEFGGLCVNCESDELRGIAIDRVLVNFDQVKHVCVLYSCLDTFEEYKRHSATWDTAFDYLCDIQDLVPLIDAMN